MVDTRNTHNMEPYTTTHKKEMLKVPNLNDNKYRKIQSESFKQGKSQEEYAKELEMNKLKSQKRK